MKFRLVFLIDECCKHIPPSLNPCAPFTKRSVHCSVLKLLTYLSDLVSHDAQRLQWGFRFFDSALSLPKYKIEQRKFCEFNLKAFEDFENALDCRLQGDSEAENVSDLPPQAVDWWQFKSNLRQCLQDVLVDYAWDSNELFSPVKALRNSSQTSNGCRNMCVLLANCPHSEEDRDQFFSSRTDPQSVLKAILPELGFKEFCDVKQIELHWVDLFPLEGCSSDVKGLKMVHDALRLIGGSILPVNALLECASHLVLPVPYRDLSGKNCFPFIRSLIFIKHCQTLIHDWLLEFSFRATKLWPVSDQLHPPLLHQM